MKWNSLSVAVVAFLFTVLSRRGVDTVLVNCMGAGTKGQTTELKCSLNEHEKPSDNIFWFPPNFEYHVVRCNFYKSRCYSDEQFALYYMGTIVSPAEYVLKIKSFDPQTDAGEWRCSHGYYKIHNCTKLTTGVLTTECRYDMNEVRCRITDTLMAGVEFFRPDGVKVAFCNRNSTHCEYVDGFSRDYVVTPAPDVVVLVMKNVNISVDVGSWACRDGRYGELSTCANSFMENVSQSYPTYTPRAIVFINNTLSKLQDQSVIDNETTKQIVDSLLNLDQPHQVNKTVVNAIVDSVAKFKKLPSIDADTENSIVDAVEKLALISCLSGSVVDSIVDAVGKLGRLKIIGSEAARVVVDAMAAFEKLDSIDPTLARILLSIVNSLLSLKPSVLHSFDKKYEICERLIKFVQYIVTKVSLELGAFIFAQDKLAASVVKREPVNHMGMMMIKAGRSSSKNRTVSVLRTNDVSDIDRNVFNALVLPRSLFVSFKEKSEENNRVAFTAYKDDVLFYKSEPFLDKPKRNVSTQVNSDVISANIPDTQIRQLSVPILISYVHTKERSNNPRCMYWAYKAENDSWEWSSKGCAVVKTNRLFTTCECRHLTHFALIMDVYSAESLLSTSDEMALSYISLCGCCISMIALLLTILTYTLFRKLREDVPSKILVNLCVALFAVNFIFVFGMKDYTFNDKLACKIVAALMHYFLLSALAWMGVEAVNMYFSLVIVFMTQIRHLVLKYMCVGWGVPLMIVLATGIHHEGRNYGLLATKICWIRNPVFYFAFLGPVAFILLMNSIAFVLVLRQIIGVSGGVQLNKSTKAKIRTQLHGAVIIIVLLGLTYMFAIFAIDQASVVFYYLFAVFNSLQGLFIFVFYCMFKKKTYDAWKSTIHSSALQSGSGKGKRTRTDSEFQDKGGSIILPDSVTSSM